jgi:hypothetical protein
VTIYDHASEHLQDHGADEADAEAILLEFGSTSGSDIPWADIVPSIPRAWAERLDKYAVGWITRKQLDAANDVVTLGDVGRSLRGESCR